MSDRRWKLMLVDDDPIFRLGLQAWLEQFPDLEVVAIADTSSTALDILAAQISPPATSLPSGPSSTATADSSSSSLSEATTEPINLDLLVTGLSWEAINPGELNGLQFCEEVKTRYPSLPIVWLGSLPNESLLALAIQLGIEGYCANKGNSSEILRAIRQGVTGQPYWPEDLSNVNQAVADLAAQAEPLEIDPSTTSRRVPLSPITVLRQNLRSSGLRQIDATLAEVATQLQNPTLSVLDRAVLAGRQRELRAARWLVRALLANPTSQPSPANRRPRNPLPLVLPQAGQAPRSRAALQRLQRATFEQPVSESTQLETVTEEAGVSFRSLQAALLDATLNKLQSNLQNLTEACLEIDVLQEEKKRELLYIILRQLEDVLDELRFSQVELSQIPGKRSAIMRDLWEAATTEFFGKYYTLRLSNRDLEVVDVLLRDALIVQAAILDKVPQVTEFLTHLLFQTPLIIDNVTYAAGTPEAMERAELLLQNLLLQVAIGVMQPLLNHFADVETIKQNFYDRRLISTREIERFRNNLSWKYRLEQYLGEPKAIFESRYWLLGLNDYGIVRVPIYAPRNEELAQLSGVQFAVTLALETRDAIAPRLRSAISFVGNGMVYVLTQVIGRGIGLVGRGILQGIGSSWQESKFGKNSERQK